MKISKSFKYKLILKPSQQIKFAQWAGSCRYLYNWGLNQRIEEYKKNKKSLSYVFQANLLPPKKNEEETKWLKDPPSQILQQALKDLDQAFKNFFRRIKKKKAGEKAGFPKFKKKNKSVDSFRLPQLSRESIRKISNKISTVKLPKIGEVKFRKSRPLEGRIRNCTVLRERSGWFISFNCEAEHKILKNKGTAIGLDRGIVHTATTSEEHFFDLPIKRIKNIENRKKVLQKRLRNKTKFSNNWRKEQSKIARLSNKAALIRHDWIHKTSTLLAKNHSYIVLEELKIKNMTKSASGTVGNPGTNVKSKSGLNRSILQQGWFKFQTILNYKCNWYGSYLDLVNPKNTSRECPKCGHISKENRIKQDVFCCEKCNHKDNADVNAAINILARGQRGKVCGDVVTRSVEKLAVKSRKEAETVSMH